MACRRLGYTRMWSIHPAQIRPIVDAFAPTVAEVDLAIEIISAAQAAHWAPIRHHDTLHDRASYRYFWQVLERAHAPRSPAARNCRLKCARPGSRARWDTLVTTRRRHTAGRSRDAAAMPARRPTRTRNWNRDDPHLGIGPDRFAPHRLNGGLATLTLALAAPVWPAQSRRRPPPRPSPLRQGRKPHKPAAKPAPKKGPWSAAPLAPAAAGEQMAAAAMAHYGDYDCEFKQTVDVGAQRQERGLPRRQVRQAVWIMKPVLSTTGALRLEDVKGRMLMLQIANKSMLMDTKPANAWSTAACTRSSATSCRDRRPKASASIPAKAASAPSASLNRGARPPLRRP
jgi:hypothetical protein